MQSAQRRESQKGSYSQTVDVNWLHELLRDFDGFLITHISQMHDSTSHNLGKARPTRLLFPNDYVLDRRRTRHDRKFRRPAADQCTLKRLSDLGVPTKPRVYLVNTIVRFGPLSAVENLTPRAFQRLRAGRCCNC